MRTYTSFNALALVLCAFLARSVYAETIWHVDASKGALRGSGTEASPFSSIQQGIDAASRADTVLVWPGTYYEQIDFSGKVITLRSVEGPDSTTIDGTGLSDSVVRCAYSADPDTVFEGFTITGGHAVNGGGMNNLACNATIINCTFSENTATDNGGGIYNVDSNPTVIGCVFSNNVAVDWSGGGMYNRDSSPTVTGCTFIENQCTVPGHMGGGGGMHNAGESIPVVTGCSFTGNSTEGGGGGMYNIEASPTVTDCSFNGNVAGSGGGGGMICNGSSSSPTLTRCTFTQNLAGEGGGLWAVSGNPTLTDCVFTENSASYGGGMSATFGSPTLTGCIFTQNTARGGGGLYSEYDASATLTNCIFTGNSATAEGQYAGGGGVLSAIASLTLINCLFAGNSGYYGGGLYGHAASDTTLINCTFAANSASQGRAIACGSASSETSTVEITNSIIRNGGDEIWTAEGSTSTVTHSNVEAGWADTGNIDEDPLFTRYPDPGPDGDFDGVDDDYGDLRLLAYSPSIDTGDPAYDPGPGATDLDRNPRVVDGDGDTIATVDMGAYESYAAQPYNVPKNRYVSFVPNNDGASVAFQVEMTVGPGPTGVLGWVSEVDENHVARVVDDPFFTAAWPAVVNVGDCEIVPAAAYELRATPDGVFFFDPMEVQTIQKPGERYYGDVVGIGTGLMPPLPGYTPPNEVVNVTDIHAYILTVEGPSSPSAELMWLDLHGEGAGSPPNFILNVSDLQRIKFGFEGQQYTDAPDHLLPADCP